jgi:hypothetical protein
VSCGRDWELGLFVVGLAGEIPEAWDGIAVNWRRCKLGWEGIVCVVAGRLYG